LPTPAPPVPAVRRCREKRLGPSRADRRLACRPGRSRAIVRRQPPAAGGRADLVEGGTRGLRNVPSASRGRCWVPSRDGPVCAGDHPTDSNAGSSVTAPGIVLDNVSKVYPGGHVALRGITLRVEPGEVLVLVGTSGSGKTTTMKMVNRLVEPTFGIVRVGG